MNPPTFTRGMSSPTGEKPQRDRGGLSATKSGNGLSPTFASQRMTSCELPKTETSWTRLTVDCSSADHDKNDKGHESIGSTSTEGCESKGGHKSSGVYMQIPEGHENTGEHRGTGCTVGCMREKGNMKV